MRNLRMPKPNILDDSPLTEREMLLFDLSIITPVPETSLYKIIIDPKVTISVARKEYTALRMTNAAMEYIASRKAQLEEYYFSVDNKNGFDDDEVELGEDGFPVGFSEKVIKLLNNQLDKPDSDEFKDALKLAFQKVSKDLEVGKSSDPPLRYLPETCSECRYRAFCESENVEDMCESCKFKHFSNSKNINYTYKEQFNEKTREAENEVTE